MRFDLKPGSILHFFPCALLALGLIGCGSGGSGGSGDSNDKDKTSVVLRIEDVTAVSMVLRWDASLRYDVDATVIRKKDNEEIGVEWWEQREKSQPVTGLVPNTKYCARIEIGIVRENVITGNLNWESHGFSNEVCAVTEDVDMPSVAGKWSGILLDESGSISSLEAQITSDGLATLKVDGSKTPEKGGGSLQLQDTLVYDDEFRQYVFDDYVDGISSSGKNFGSRFSGRLSGSGLPFDVYLDSRGKRAVITWSTDNDIAVLQKGDLETSTFLIDDISGEWIGRGSRRPDSGTGVQCSAAACEEFAPFSEALISGGSFTTSFDSAKGHWVGTGSSELLNPGGSEPPRIDAVMTPDKKFVAARACSKLWRYSGGAYTEYTSCKFGAFSRF